MDTWPSHNFHLPFKSGWNVHSNCIGIVLWLSFLLFIFILGFFSNSFMLNNCKIVSVAYPWLSGPFHLAQRIWIAGHCHIVFCFTPKNQHFFELDVVFKYILLNGYAPVRSKLQLEVSHHMNSVIPCLYYLLFLFCSVLSIRISKVARHRSQAR